MTSKDNMSEAKKAFMQAVKEAEQPDVNPFTGRAYEYRKREDIQADIDKAERDMLEARKRMDALQAEYQIVTERDIPKIF